MGTTTIEKPAQTDLVSCEVCLKEVPISEATIAEAADYFTYFCGLACFEQWKHRGEQAQHRPRGESS